LDAEKPTPSEGASITDRLEKMLAAEHEPVKEPPKAEATQDAEVKDEPEKQAAPEPDKPDSDAPGEEKQPQLSTSDLAKVFGVDESTFDVDADGNVVVKLKADGKELAPKFADLIQSYQVKGHVDNESRKVAEQARAQQARAQDQEAAFQQRLNHAEQLAALAAQELMSEFKQYDWNALDQHPDQGAVAALKLKFQERNAKIQNALQGINGHRAQLGKQAELQQAQRVAEETERLPTLIPEWKDRAVAGKEAAAIREWGLKVGYTAQDLASLNQSSALHVATVRKAMLYDQLQQSKSVVENKVRLAPKIVKPGQAVQDGPGQRVRDLKEQVRKSGGKGGSVAAYLLAAGKV
jgi:hypothetical protein